MSQPPSSTLQLPLALSAMEFESTLTFFRLLKVAQLKDLCKLVGLALKGKKQDLLDRLELYARSCYAAGENIRLLAIRSVVLKMLNHDPVPDFHNLCNALQLGLIDFQQLLQQNMQQNTRLTLGMGQVQNRKLPPKPKPANPMAGGYSTGNNLHGLIYYPKYTGPMLLFPSTLFYQLIRMVHGFPYMMIASKGRNVCNVSVSLNAEEIELLRRSPDARLYLFSGLSSTPNPAKTPIQFPPIEIHVDGLNTKQYVKGLKGKPGTCRPADLTKYVNNFNRQFTVNVVYSDAPEPYILYMYIVHARSPETLVEKIEREGSHIPIDVTKRAIEHDYEQNQDDDIVMDTSSISLRCPLTYARMKHPMKLTSCDHVQCFDGLLFLTMQERIPSWICPVCSAQLDQNLLAVLDYMSNILKNTSEEVESVMLNTDGSWSVPMDTEPKKENSAAPKSPSAPAPSEHSAEPANESIEVISLDSESEEESAPPQPTQHHTPTLPEHTIAAHHASPPAQLPSIPSSSELSLSAFNNGREPQSASPQNQASPSGFSSNPSLASGSARGQSQSQSPQDALSPPNSLFGRMSLPAMRTPNTFAPRPQIQPQQESNRGPQFSSDRSSPDTQRSFLHHPPSFMSRPLQSYNQNGGGNSNSGSGSNSSMSGMSGMSGLSGMSGMSGGSGLSRMSGLSGASGRSGLSNLSGRSGANIPNANAGPVNPNRLNSTRENQQRALNLMHHPNDNRGHPNENRGTTNEGPGSTTLPPLQESSSTSSKPNLPPSHHSPSLPQLHGHNQSLPLPLNSNEANRNKSERLALADDNSSDNEPLARRNDVPENVSLASLSRGRLLITSENRDVDMDREPEPAEPEKQAPTSNQPSIMTQERAEPAPTNLVPTNHPTNHPTTHPASSLGKPANITENTRLPPIVTQQHNTNRPDQRMSPPPEQQDPPGRPNVSPRQSQISPTQPRATTFGQYSGPRLPPISNLTPGLRPGPPSVSRTGLHVPWAKTSSMNSTSSLEPRINFPSSRIIDPSTRMLSVSLGTPKSDLGRKNSENGEAQNSEKETSSKEATSSTRAKSPTRQLSKIGSVIEKIQQQYSRPSSPNPEGSKSPEPPLKSASDLTSRPGPAPIQTKEYVRSSEKSSSNPSIPSVYEVSDGSNDNVLNSKISEARARSSPSVTKLTTLGLNKEGDRSSSLKQNHLVGSVPRNGPEAARQNAIAERYRQLILTSSSLINDYNRMALDPSRAISGKNGIPVRPSQPNTTLPSYNGSGASESAESSNTGVSGSPLLNQSGQSTSQASGAASNRAEPTPAAPATDNRGVNKQFTLNKAPQDDAASSVSMSPLTTTSNKQAERSNDGEESTKNDKQPAKTPIGNAGPPQGLPAASLASLPEKPSEKAQVDTRNRSLPNQQNNMPTRGETYSKSAFDVLTEEEALEKIKGVLGIEISGSVLRSKSPFAAIAAAQNAENNDKQNAAPAPQATPVVNRIQEHTNGDSTSPIDSRIEKMTIETPNEKKRSILNSSSERLWNKRLNRETSKKFDPSEINSSQIIELDD